jgi:hypothetical protein
VAPALALPRFFKPPPLTLSTSNHGALSVLQDTCPWTHHWAHSISDHAGSRLVRADLRRWLDLDDFLSAIGHRDARRAVVADVVRVAMRRCGRRCERVSS